MIPIFGIELTFTSEYYSSLSVTPNSLSICFRKSGTGNPINLACSISFIMRNSSRTTGGSPVRKAVTSESLSDPYNVY